MKKFVCSICGYVYEGEAAPEKCPQCGAPASKFTEVASDDGLKFACEHIVGIAKEVDDKEFIDKMLKIINDNISNTEISTKFIADELGVSIRNLYRRLEGILNQTPTNIIKEYRLAKAEQLLTTTKLSIDEIIYKAGFVNRGTFFKCFSAKYGCTPKVYRKEKLSQIRQEVGEESEDAADRSA